MYHLDWISLKAIDFIRQSWSDTYLSKSIIPQSIETHIDYLLTYEQIIYHSYGLGSIHSAL